jgi:uncharacterized integral membrane protein
VTEQQPSSTTTTHQPQPEVARGVRGTRTGALWTLVSLSVLVAVITIIFIVQNSQKATVSFLSWDGHVPLFVLLLCATVLGALLVLFAGMARIAQLRLAARRQRKLGVRSDDSDR